MEPTLVAGLIAGAVILALAIALVGSGWSMRGRSADAEKALESGRADRAEALAEHRRLRLVEAAARAVRKATGAAADAAHEASIGDALASAGGDVDAAVELLLGASGGRAPGPSSPADSPGPDAPAGLDRGAAGVVGSPPSGPARG